jgi:hypothetical protein
MAGPVLIIEDDPDIAEVLCCSLEKENFQTRVALTGEEGLIASLDKANLPSIIVLDLLLPGMKGTEMRLNYSGGNHGSSSNIWNQYIDEFCEFCRDCEALHMAAASDHEPTRLAD